ncbi:hypothetical protein BAU85_002329 [Escherichia coli]|nr:hypothetical protein [Escherichia coli]EGC2473801.1 hypothetical protein [Escherichia coli]EGI4460802.1 hypothetical protein [Escherichia coli]HBA9620995.1 hypothetical protein [Escherichia coli]HBB0805420.1 hypothetical protein [Escherichia coli]
MPRVPRASGDKPGHHGFIQVTADEFPAPAGINRCAIQRSTLIVRVPRASGDKPGALDAMMDIT